MTSTPAILRLASMSWHALFLYDRRNNCRTLFAVVKMKTPIWNRYKLLGAGLATTGLLVGCASLPYASMRFTSPSVRGGDDNVLSLAADVSKLSVSSSFTTSRALDRIDQRGLPLDATYRRSGTGKGVTVYVFDGGVSPIHPELAGRVRLGYTAFPNDPKICNAHGTAVAGAIAGENLGVAPEAEIVDVKMVECGTLRGTIRGIVEGAKWVVKDHEVRGGPAVANWSFIADTISSIPALDSAVALLRAAGVAVMVSAGNFDINACRVSPGNAEGAFVVGAASLYTDSTTGRTLDRRTPGTAYGPCIDVFAPGDSVLLPSLDGEMHPITQAWNGTSMATGYASGAAALFLQLRPDASPDQVAEHLRRSATRNAITGAMSPFPRVLYVGLPDAQVRQQAIGPKGVDSTWLQGLISMAKNSKGGH